MNKLYVMSLCLLFSCSNKNAFDPPEARQKECPVVSVKFSPNGGAEEAIIEGLNASKKTIRVQAYSFTAVHIAEALVSAKSRGVEVIVIADREATGNPNSVVKYLKENNIPVYIDGKHAIAHNKIIIIDGEIVLTGSYNYSKAANERNAENSVRIGDAKLAKTYTDNWDKHKEHSQLSE